jgi:hypothetical protein
MSICVWSTRKPRDEAFARVWDERLARTTHAHYAMRLDYLAWEAHRGHHAAAILIDDAGRGAAMVLREEAGSWVSGWPWRWQAVVEGPDRPASGLRPEECAWLFAHAEQFAAARRLRCFLPAPPAPGSPGFVVAVTRLRDVTPSDDALLRGMDVNKRRGWKRAKSEGYEVIEATTPEQFRAFAALQVETESRRGEVSPPIVDDPPAGEAWREWELPWMRLLVAVRAGKVEAGSGFGWQPGGILDYRANASSVEGKRLGANVLLAIEGIRWARDRGLRWVNWGGDTMFKRELGGDPVEVACHLGGGAAWAVPNLVAASLQRARPWIASWWQGVRTRQKAPAR